MRQVRLHIIVIYIGMLMLQCIVLHAQHTDMVDSSQTQVFADTGKRYIMPEPSAKSMRWTKGSNKFFSWQLGFAPIVDYSYFIQNDASEEQVGKQADKAELRSGRVSVRGKINFMNPWQYFLSVEYKGLDRDPDDDPFGVTDAYISIPAGKLFTVTAGKIKESFVYELVGDAANLPHTERILNPFFVSRNIGVKLNRTLLNDLITVAAVWGNDWWTKGESFKESGNTFTARVTGLPYVSADGNPFIHAGVSVRYLEAENDVLRYRGRNESNVTGYYVDTKEFPADHAWHLGIEQLWSLENFSLLTEYVHTWAHTPDGSEQFNGYYLTGSWIISGEQRPYDRKAAYARRVKPDGKGGAWEIVARASRIDLDGRNVQGGILRKFYFGLNWWATQYWRASFGYGPGNLEKDGLTGVTNGFIFRLQWVR